MRQRCFHSYLMHEARQNGNMPGMKNALLDRARTALVVIDLQKGVVGRTTAPHAAEVVVKNAAALAAAFRKNEMPVFLVRVAFSPDGKDMLILVRIQVETNNPRPSANVSHPISI